ncbi:MAG: ZIP family metal transporter [Desulfurococcales archaeon]|nr:ZIP family metal transporter [Desulfurococcales archaeon]
MSLVSELLDFLLSLADGDKVLTALVMSLFAASLTTLGSILVLFIRRPTEMEKSSLILDVGMAFSSGIMTVASFTSLLLPAIELSGIAKPLAGFMAGAISIYFLNRIIPHEHFIRGYEGPQWGIRKLKAAWLVALAIIIHNLPEGMAIGASTALDPREGGIVGIAIGIQDFPEGLAVALPVAIATGNRMLAILVGAVSGASEILTSMLAVLGGIYSIELLPFLLGYGAGAMMYVVSHEALPESHRTGHEENATVGFFLGFIVMLYLDSTLG